MVTEPIVSLASSVQAAPGTYALLVGSGISKSALVPSAYDVVIDLVRRTAIANGVDAGDDPAAWYVDAYGRDADYSDLLEDLAPSQADRRALLERYFVPTDDERVLGHKLPTAAHRSIAQLVADKFIRVVVTTNFDRLLETALTEAGVDAQVITSGGSAAGATVLNHAGATIVKVHGDYLSPDLRNTVTELAGYEPEVDSLLDEIIDRYGLIICGWSGRWDVALREALERASNRRYPLYWCRRSALTAEAKALVAQRDGIEIPIVDADQFFGELANKVTLLAELSGGSPLTTELLVAELKRYLPDPTQRIRLVDLIDGVTSETASAIGVAHFPTPTGTFDADSFRSHIREYKGKMDRLLAVLTTGTRFGEAPQEHLWVSAVERIERRPRNDGGNRALVELQGYPTVLCVFALGLAGVASGNIGPFLKCLDLPISSQYGSEPERLVERASPASGIGAGLEVVAFNEQKGRYHTPGSDHVHDAMKSRTSSLFLNEEEYERSFDIVEFLIALCYWIQRGGGWAPLGRFWWRGGRFRPEPPDVKRFAPTMVEIGLAGSLAEVEAAIEQLTSYVHSNPLR
jgi:hypothetical protein